MADLSSLQGTTFSPDDYSEAVFVNFNGDGTATAVATSNADGGSSENNPAIGGMVVSVDTAASTPLGLGTVTIQDETGGTAVGSPNVYDVIGTNSAGQVLLGLGTYDPTDPSNPYNSNYALLSGTSLDLADNGGAQPTITVSSPGIVPCFAAGALIATPSGEIPVEDLRAGDLVITVSGEAKPVIWAGSRRVDIARHPRPDSVRPVRIEAGAFADNAPTRDLVLSPDHSVFVDGVLIPAKYLVNGTSIVQLDQASVTYHHIELAAHDVVFANGLPAETYLETGNRMNFAGQHEKVFVPHPDFAGSCDTNFFLWESLGYAPIVLIGAPLDNVRARLAQRASRRSAAKRASRRAA